MKYSLDIRAVHQDRAVLDSLAAFLPASDDANVWGAQYDNSGVIQEDSGLYSLRCMIRFDSSVNAANLKSSALSVGGVLATLEVGSYIRLHDCDHDNLSGGCVSTEIWEVT